MKFTILYIIHFLCSGYLPTSVTSFSITSSSSHSTQISEWRTRPGRKTGGAADNLVSSTLRCDDGIGSKNRRRRHYHPKATTKTTTSLHDTTATNTLEQVSASLNGAFDGCRKDVTRTCSVKVGPSPTLQQQQQEDGRENNLRLGLIATTAIKKGDVIINIPYDERWDITASVARNVVFKGILDKDYDGWTGDTGLLALQLLNEVARVSSSTGAAGISQPSRPESIQDFMAAWVKALPGPKELDHPLLWPEEDQEVLQSSSNTKIYRVLDDIDEDVSWLVQNVFSKDRTKFPETISLMTGGVEGDLRPCFSLEGYKWAMALVQSRAVFVDGSLRLLPFMDMCNHEDGAREIEGGTMGAFGTTKGAQVVASRSFNTGDEVFCSYGPKSAADYLLEHGFCPPQCWKTAISEITLEMDPEDRFYDDKLDILEFETYDQAPMDPTQSFDVVSMPGRDGEPDPALIQFARLRQLGGFDAFLLESIFRKEVWGFMSLPVSETNELKVVEAISEVCESAIEDLKQCPEGGPAVCTKLRESEMKALTRTLEFMLREKEALDLKEYYQERRLKDLGLDSDWSPEDDMANPDLNFGQSRAPGGADYDW